MPGFDPAFCPRCGRPQDRKGITPCSICVQEIGKWVEYIQKMQAIIKKDRERESAKLSK